jgi:RecA-family ATPase
LLTRHFSNDLLDIGDGCLAAIDSGSLVFDDNEIERRSVRRFLMALNRQAHKLDTAIVLAAHTSRTSDGSATRMASGSTGWIAHVRAGLYLKRGDDDSEATLTLVKSNYSRPGVKIDLVWADDVLIAKDAPVGALAGIEQRRDDEMVLVEIAARWEGDGDPLSRSSNTSERYLPRAMARLGRMSQIRASAAMVRLADAQRITTDQRRGVTGLRPISHEKK